MRRARPGRCPSDIYASRQGKCGPHCGSSEPAQARRSRTLPPTACHHRPPGRIPPHHLSQRPPGARPATIRHPPFLRPGSWQAFAKTYLRHNGGAWRAFRQRLASDRELPPPTHGLRPERRRGIRHGTHGHQACPVAPAPHPHAWAQLSLCRPANGNVPLPQHPRPSYRALHPGGMPPQAESPRRGEPCGRLAQRLG